MNCATFSALAPATINMCPPIAADCSTSRGPRPGWPSCKPHDPGLASSQLRRYWLARALTEPIAVQTDRTCRGRYEALRARGHSYGRALRGVADRLLGVACVLLQHQVLFDPDHGTPAGS
jgi:hypothetical protein